MKFELKPWNDSEYAKFLVSFHTPSDNLNIPVAATVEYIKAFKDTIADQGFVYNMSINAIDHMPPDVASYAKYGDFREFTPGQAWLGECAQVVGSILGPYSHIFG